MPSARDEERFPELGLAHDIARRFLDELPTRQVGARATVEELRQSLSTPLSEEGQPVGEVLEQLSEAVRDGLIASAGPRYFGFVIGGGLPAARGADWLTSVWDQNAAVYATSPAASVVEEVVGRWLVDLFGLPPETSVGLVTGGQMANFTALLVARHAVLKRSGWDVEAKGMAGAPLLRVVASEEAHATVLSALAYLGIGHESVERVRTDDQGRMRADDLERVLGAGGETTIVCSQAGNVNTGSFDPIAALAELTRRHGAWLHVDGAFGLWAAASPAKRQLTAGIEQADSWAVDAHKWLNVPYDSGIVLTAHPEAHRATLAISAAYFVESQSERDPHNWVPESSRRARGFSIYAALRSLGRRGVAELVERCCALAARMAERLRGSPRLEILNEMVLNQVLVGVRPPQGGDEETFVRDLASQVQREGTCWLAPTHWQGRPALRISVSNWSTTEADIDVSAEAIRRAAGG